MRLEGYDDRVIANVPSRRDCEELCLRERGFKCRSAGYNTVTLECALSPETRRTKPDAYKKSNSIEYLENQCIKPGKKISFSILNRLKTNLLSIQLPFAVKGFSKQKRQKFLVR